MIFVATTFFYLVNLIQLPRVLTPFLTFQLSSGSNALPDFFRTSFLQTLITYRFFCLYILILKIVNNISIIINNNNNNNNIIIIIIIIHNLFKIFFFFYVVSAQRY